MSTQQQQKFDISDYVSQLAMAARVASRSLAKASSKQRNQAITTTAEAIDSSVQNIKKGNRIDLDAGSKNGLSDAMLDRLDLTDERISLMIEGLLKITDLPDPVGQVSEIVEQPSGIRVGRMRVPLGVIGIVYESRPNVTAEVGGLCIKSGNAVVLRGGSEAINSNYAIFQCFQKGLKAANLDASAVQFIESADRSAIDALVRMDDYIDVIVPRGGKNLIERIMSQSTIPIIKHLDGVCHVYVDDDACFDKAFDIVINSKTHRYGVCNATETLLISKKIAESFLPRIASALRDKGVELRGCQRSRNIYPQMSAASDDDWYEEYLAPILAVRIVDSVDDAIDHIEKYGSQHTDCIVTENLDHANRFMREVDSSSVMLNASTRFADGFEYGLGAEIGISTNKLHARGPVGLEGLTTQKFVVYGDGTVRE